MMLAKPRAARRNLVLGVRELTAQAHRLVFGRAHPAERQVHAAECGLALDETEGLRNGEFEGERSEEHTSELQSLMRISYAVFCLQKKTKYNGARHRLTV